MQKDALVKVTALVGAHDLAKSEDEQVRVKVGKDNIFAHSRIDVALLRSFEKIKSTNAIIPVSLPKNLDKDYEGAQATAVGWGEPGKNENT
jgi:Trypsin